MGNNKEKAITKMSMRLREENAPAIVEIKLVDDEFSSYMERKIQDDSYRFSVLADFVKRKEQGEILSIDEEKRSIEATYELWMDVDKYFGTKTRTDSSIWMIRQK